MSPFEYRHLRAAPERIVVDLADVTLGALLTALELEHPTLAKPPFEPEPEPPTLRRARALVRLTRRLRRLLDVYRRSVDAVLAEPDDGFPF